MKEIQGDLFELAKGYDLFAIPTNGAIRQNGALVMGKGLAKTASDRWPSLPFVIARMIREQGHVLHLLHESTFLERGQTLPAPFLVAFPVKPEWAVSNGTRIPGWKADAQMPILERSAVELAVFLHENFPLRALIPRVGCGAGNLLWSDVKPALTTIFARHFVLDRVDVCFNE